MTDTSKQELRQIVKKRKALLTDEYKCNTSLHIMSEIEHLPLFLNAHRILSYWSLDDEVNTHKFNNKWSKQKEIYLPVINGDSLRIVRFFDESDLIVEDRFGVGEPRNNQELADLTLLDLVIVPGVAYDADNNRMGRGKAFYDKLLTNVNAPKIGICFACQFFPVVPHDEYDVKMDMVVYK